ncbi:MAG: DUF2312 domain-containing protein [Nitrospirae bacterium]|nr:DUF2312 domain-containing protein [Magnetococcales bacterium]
MSAVIREIESVIGTTEEQEGTSSEQLVRIIDRIERLEEEKAGISSGIRDVYAEAKSQGFDPIIIRKVIGLRKKDPNERDEEEAALHLYMQALGMQ